MDWNHEFSLFLLSLWDIVSFIIRLSALVMIPQKHRPATATAWLLVILFWPWPGIIAYSLLGTNVLPQKRMEIHRSMLSHMHEMRERLKRKEIPGASVPELPAALGATASLAEHLGYLCAVKGNAVTFITSTRKFIDNLIALIDGAEKEVNLLYYIFATDSYAEEVAAACLRAVKRGVTVRMLLDSVGSRYFLTGITAFELKRAGVMIAEALPARIYRAKVQRFDLRNHRKLAVIDHTTAITGSHNVTLAEYGSRNIYESQDVSLKLRGPIVRQLESVFIEDWHVETGETLDTSHLFSEKNDFAGNACLQTVPSGPSYETENYQRLIIASIIGAEHQVTITTPYLIPDSGMFQAIEIARLRGVRVRLIIPRQSDQIIVDYASRAYYEDFMKRGVEIYLYQNGLLHAKTMTVDDDLGFVGSSNFDIRSFYLNFEINMILYGIEENTCLNGIQECYIRTSERLTLEKWKERGHIAMALESVTKLLSPLL